MSDDVYRRLADGIIRRASSIPVVDCPEFINLITDLFTPAQAEMGAVFPMGLRTADQAAAEVDRPVDEVRDVLESMANAGLVFTGEQEGETVYRMMDVLPGFFEFQFMKGGVSEADKKRAHLFRDYFDKMQESLKDIPEPFMKLTPFSRIIQIDKEIAGGTVVHPFETVSEYIEKAGHITVCQCYCRHYGELLGDPCDKPKEVCMAFGPSAKYVSDRGYGRPVSKEEARKILDEVEKAGLVHVASNTSQYIDFICNCCACHCGVLKSFSDSNAPSMAVISNFELEISSDECVGCGDCLEQCPVEALTLKDEVVQVERLRCIGCGVCNIVCPSKCLSMKRREESIDPPGNRKDLQVRIKASLDKAFEELSQQQKN